MNRKWLLLLVGLVIVFVVDFLIVMVILNSFRTTEDILASRIAPAQLTLANYSYINTRTSFWTYLFNSAVVASNELSPEHRVGGIGGFRDVALSGKDFAPYNQALLIVQMFPLILAVIPPFSFAT